MKSRSCYQINVARVVCGLLLLMMLFGSASAEDSAKKHSSRPDEEEVAVQKNLLLEAYSSKESVSEDAIKSILAIKDNIVSGFINMYLSCNASEREIIFSRIASAVKMQDEKRQALLPVYKDILLLVSESDLDISLTAKGLLNPDWKAMNWLETRNSPIGRSAYAPGYVRSLHRNLINVSSGHERFASLTPENIKTLKLLDLSCLSLRGDAAENIKRLTSLEEINLNWCYLEDVEGLFKSLSTLKSLKVLRINGCKSLKHRREKSAFKQVLDDCPLVELECFDALSESDLITLKDSLAKLKVLSIGGEEVKITNQGLSCLKELGCSIRLNLINNGVTHKGYMEFIKDTNIEYLELSGVGDDYFIPLKENKSLKSFVIHDSRATKKGFAALKDCPLIEFKVSGQLDDAGFATVRNFKALESLGVYGTSLSDKGIRNISGLKELKNISIKSKNISVKGVETLKKLKNIEFLELDGISPIPAARKSKKKVRKPKYSVGELVAKSVKHLPALKRLYYGRINVDDSVVKELRTLTGLEHFDAYQINLSDDGLKYICKLSLLRGLNLKGPVIHQNPITDKGVEHLSVMTKLEDLDLSSSKISEKGLEHLLRMPNLKRLTLHRCENINDDSLEILKRFVNLTFLNLSGTKVNKSAKDMLKAVLKRCEFR